MLVTLLGILSTVIQDTPEAIALFQTVSGIVTSGNDPTPAQMQTLLSQMSAVHTKVQNA